VPHVGVTCSYECEQFAREVADLPDITPQEWLDKQFSIFCREVLEMEA
jgi:hypothetical protein